MEIILNKDNFKSEVLDSTMPVLVDFFATWCAPCMMMSPELEKIAEKFEGKLKVCKIDVDNDQQLAVEYRIMNIPALKLFAGGKVIAQTVGYHTADELERFLKENNI